uniref:Glyco_hydro_18 domain-containing protein n=1 Tax=Strongyloides papillosus TaxID=174720 RepID=A0A0N5C499_STREA
MRKVNPKVKIMFAISKPEQAQDFIDLISTNEGRAILISEIIKMIELYGFDGVDLGWERPQASSVAKVVPEDISRYLMLICEMRKAFNDFEGKKKRNGKLIISFAGPESEQLSKSEINLYNISVNVDFINVIDYNYFLLLNFNEDVSSVTPAPLSSGSLETIPEITMETDLKLKYYYCNSIDFEKLHMVIPFARKTLENIGGNITELGKKLDIRKDWPGDSSKSTYRVKSSSIASPSSPTKNVVNIVVNKIKVNNTWFNIPSNSQYSDDLQVITGDDQFKLTNITLSVPSNPQNNNEIIIVFKGYKNTHSNTPRGAQNGSEINIMMKVKKVEPNKYYWDRKIHKLKESSKGKHDDNPKDVNKNYGWKHDRSYQCKNLKSDKCKCTIIHTVTLTYKVEERNYSEKLKNGRKFNVSETSDNVPPKSQNTDELQILVNELKFNIDYIVVFVPSNILNDDKNDNMKKKNNKIENFLEAKHRDVEQVEGTYVSFGSNLSQEERKSDFDELINSRNLKMKGVDYKSSQSKECSLSSHNEFVCTKVYTTTYITQGYPATHNQVSTYPKRRNSSFFEQEKVVSAKDTLTALHIKGNKRTNSPGIFISPNSIEKTMSYVGKKNLGGLIILGIEEDDNSLLLDTINASNLCNYKKVHEKFQCSS